MFSPINRAKGEFRDVEGVSTPKIASSFKNSRLDLKLDRDVLYLPICSIVLFRPTIQSRVTAPTELKTFFKGHRSPTFWIEVFELFCPNNIKVLVKVQSDSRHLILSRVTEVTNVGFVLPFFQPSSDPCLSKKCQGDKGNEKCAQNRARKATDAVTYALAVSASTSDPQTRLKHARSPPTQGRSGSQWRTTSPFILSVRPLLKAAQEVIGRNFEHLPEELQHIVGVGTMGKAVTAREQQCCGCRRMEHREFNCDFTGPLAGMEKSDVGILEAPLAVEK
ncbi:hypothetical protein B0H13DRAFT_1850994 [Mycena leptocephala]|nr:hypothetical protein B0H13DRAFT_1850994 [Mycena leptocephala]